MGARRRLAASPSLPPTLFWAVALFPHGRARRAMARRGKAGSRSDREPRAPAPQGSGFSPLPPSCRGVDCRETFVLRGER